MDELDNSVDILTLVDEDGVEHEFEIADVLELEDDSYMALIPCPQNPEKHRHRAEGYSGRRASGIADAEHRPTRRDSAGRNHAPS